MAKSIEQLEQVTIRFAGDSGDGMQLTGAASRARPRPSATTYRRCPTSRQRSEHPPARYLACPASRSTSPITTSSRQATSPMCWWR